MPSTSRQRQVKHTRDRELSLRDCLAQATSWSVYKKGRSTNLRFMPKDQTGYPLLADGFVLKDFALIDARLPVVLSHWVGGSIRHQQVGAIAVDTLRGIEIRNTLTTWQTPCHRFPSGAFGVPDGELPVPVEKILDFRYPPGSVHASMDYLTFTEMTTPCGIVYAVGHRYVTRSVRLEWLDREYPGWRERYALADNLSLSDAAGYILQSSDDALPEPAQRADLPEQLSP